MKPVSNSKLEAEDDYGIASEDVEGDESPSHHYFGGNKELFEHTKHKNIDSNLHSYQAESTFELSRLENYEGSSACA